MSERTCCVIEDGKVCGRPVEGRGWCSMHYQRWQNNGDPLISKRPRQQPVCTQPDCGKPSYQKSRCLKHYREWQASQRGPCSVDDCEEPWKSNGLCGTHYTRWRRTGSTDAPAPTGRPCSVEGCTERTRAHEYCQKHYRNWRKHGTPIPPGQTREGSGAVLRGSLRRHGHPQERDVRLPLSQVHSVHQTNLPTGRLRGACACSEPRLRGPRR